MQNSQEEKENLSNLQENHAEMQENLQESRARKLAATFKFYRQYKIKSVETVLPIERIATKDEYNKNKKFYDKLLEISEKYRINAEKYIRYNVFERGVTDPRNLLDIVNIQSYVTYLNIEDEMERIYTNFNRTAEDIADICIENNITPAEYISYLVNTNNLAYEYYSGNISKHYLASIQNFSELYSKLDYLNREELSIIYEANEQLRNTLYEAFERYGISNVKPLSYTEGIITKKQKQNKLNK